MNASMGFIRRNHHVNKKQHEERYHLINKDINAHSWKRLGYVP